MQQSSNCTAIVSVISILTFRSLQKKLPGDFHNCTTFLETSIDELSSLRP